MERLGLGQRVGNRGMILEKPGGDQKAVLGAAHPGCLCRAMVPEAKLA